MDHTKRRLEKRIYREDPDILNFTNNPIDKMNMEIPKLSANRIRSYGAITKDTAYIHDPITEDHE
jgi:hypothetical protein